jgi:sporulation protein YlmC with PRC-barrel domain
VESGLTVIGRAPQQIQGQEVWRTAQRQLNEAQQALQGGQPNQQQATNQMREAADALGTLAGRMGGSADSTNSTSGGSPSAGAAGSGAQITVQQSQPQITVTQPQPQVTVTQPQPQVTVRQAEPQVTVQQQGQPQVTVQRQGEPQVTVQRPNQPAAANGSSQRSGTTAAPTPSQSGGSQPQQAAVTSSGGIALQSVQDMVGKNVVGSNGRDAGEVQNLLIDSAGRVRAAVIEWGGFLGIGDRQAMVPIDRIQLSPGGNDRARLNMTRDELEALPRYERDRVADYGRQQAWGDGLRLYR